MTRVNNFVKNGGRLCRTLVWSVSVDVDPNVRRKKIPKFSVFFPGGYPRFSQPAKTAYQTAIKCLCGVCLVCTLFTRYTSLY